jgi:aspartyl-tRNA(Asn)/glutamyl-tRNA(Gln) amidotransferase subunit A
MESRKQIKISQIWEKISLGQCPSGTWAFQVKTMSDFLGTIESLADRYAKGILKPSKVVAAHIDQIIKKDSKLGAFQHVFFDEAMEQAISADKALAAGCILGPFHGIPFALKDIYEHQGQICTHGSMANKGRVSTVTGTVVSRLLAAGGILLGRTKTVEHAFGGWGTNQKMGSPCNPWKADEHHIAGGSSSGSAVATAAGMAVCAIGSDTGGSVRLPAAFCGVTGLKITEGRLECDGIMPLSQTLDTPGPITQTVADSVILFDVMAGRDGKDINSDRRDGLGIYGALIDTVAGLRLGSICDEQRAQCSNAVLASYDHALATLEELGALVSPFYSPFDFGDLANDNGDIIAIEAYFNHGHLYEQADLPMDEDVRMRVLSGKKFPAYSYLKMLQRRRDKGQQFISAMQGFDAILTPTTTCTAPLLSKVDQSISPAHFTRPFNYLGLCGLSVPTGLADDALPVGLQIVARPHDEAMAVRVGNSLEKALPKIGRP